MRSSVVSEWTSDVYPGSNQFGGLFAGPIRRNSTFFMVAYEGLRNFTDSILSQNTITTAERGGLLPTPATDPTTGLPFPGNQILPGRISATATAAMAIDPLPNQNPATNGGNDFGYLIPTPRDDDEGVVKVDQSFGQHDQLSGRYIICNLFVDKLSYTVGALDLIQAPILTKNLTFIETHVLSPTAVVASRIAFNREHNENLYPEVLSGTNMNQLFSINNPYYPGANSLMNTYPLFTITNFTDIGLDGGAPLIQPDQNYEIASDVSLTRGRHSLKTGFELDRYRSDRQVNDNTNGILPTSIGLFANPWAVRSMSSRQNFPTPHPWQVSSPWETNPASPFRISITVCMPDFCFNPRDSRKQVSEMRSAR